MRVPSDGDVTQGFSSEHRAVDIAYVGGGAASYGQPIVAPEDGVVTYVGQMGAVGTKDDAGTVIQMSAGPNMHRLCHLIPSSPTAKVGDLVSKGQVVGQMGYSGYVKPEGKEGSHLHWILEINGVRVNGLDYVTEEGDNEMVTYNQLQQLSQAVLGRKEPVTKEWYESNPAERSMTLDQVLDAWIPSEEAKNFRFKGWDYDRLVSEQADDEFEVATVYVKKK